ncbi:hypothetical protein BDV93DRAFT_554398 [Ceratobasidium sp. AG-I]|nr:hypothetical protein BDV93DRAFT_554398 [Ceratobasidium sp. AG-I]
MSYEVDHDPKLESSLLDMIRAALEDLKRATQGCRKGTSSGLCQGTSITHYADSGPNRGPVGVSIDGLPYENATWTNVGNVQYKQWMWKTTDLSPGDHQIVVSNVGTGDPATSLMGLDYFEITPNADGNIFPTMSGPGASVIPSNAVLVDDTSNMISYTESWSIYNSYKHRGIYLGGTQHSSSTPGGSAIFRFNGTAVWYFCDQYDSNSVVSVSVDGGAPDMVNTASTAGLWLSQIIVWSKTGLTDGPHTVNITHVGTDTTYANVDFFKYMPSSTSPRPPGTSNTSTIKPVPIGAIVGGVVGGVVLIAFIAGLLIWRRKRQPTPGATMPAHETYIGDAAANRGHPDSDPPRL